MWLGYNAGGSRKGNSMFFVVPAGYDNKYVTADEHGKRLMQTSAKWFTNLDHGKRHQSLQLDTMAHNLKFNKKLRKKFEQDYGKLEYPHYDNYDALEVPFTECIPSDYNGVMGVPITFMDKYDPDQFDIAGMAAGNTRATGFYFGVPYSPHPEDRGGCGVVNGKRVYARILIRSKKGDNR